MFDKGRSIYHLNLQPNQLKGKNMPERKLKRKIFTWLCTRDLKQDMELTI